MTIRLILISTLLALVQSIHSYDIYINRKEPPIQILSDDVGVPLILTPLIEQGQISEAVQLAAVTSDVFTMKKQNITSFTGYLTVDKNFNSNLFFWFFPSENNPETDPVILWLQGGPGASSMYGLFTENGPYVVDEDLNLGLRYNSWTWNHSVIYIDSPAGTGFSFTSGGFANNQTKVGEDLYEALIQFFTLFPEYQKNDFFITGESYGGHFIPALGYTIYKKNPEADLKINLQGLAIGNPLTDVKYQADYGSHMYFLGLIDSNTKDNLDRQYANLVSAVDCEDYASATSSLDEIRSTWRTASGIPNVYNHQDIKPEDPNYWADYLIQESIRPMIHVGNTSYGGTDSVVASHLSEDRSRSLGPWLAELIDNYRVLLYNGQLDTLDPYPLMINLIKSLNFTRKQEYLRAERKIWYVGNEIAGYSKSGGKFTEVLVRDAGHMVPSNQPSWAYDLIYKFVRDIPFDQ